MVFHLNLISTRNTTGAETTYIQCRRSTIESSAARDFTCGYNLSYQFPAKLNIVLPEDVYKTLVKNCGPLMKLYKTVKCLLRVVSRSTKYKQEVIYLSQEAFMTIVKSSQKWIPIDLRKKVQVDGMFGTTPIAIISHRDTYLASLTS